MGGLHGDGICVDSMRGESAALAGGLDTLHIDLRHPIGLALLYWFCVILVIALHAKKPVDRI